MKVGYWSVITIWFVWKVKDEQSWDWEVGGSGAARRALGIRAGAAGPEGAWVFQQRIAGSFTEPNL